MRLFRSRREARRPSAREATSRLVLAALLLGAGVASAADLVPLSPEQQHAFGIELAAPVPTGETLTRRYPAEVAVPNRQLRVVSAPQAGVLEALLVAEGERVEAGQAIARLKSPELVAAQSGYLEAATRLDLARTQLERDRTLLKEGVIAERRLLESEARHRELATQAEQRRQVLELAGLSEQDIAKLAASGRLGSSLPVRTPIGGVVLEQLVSTGQSVAAATPLYRVAELDPLWVEAHVPVDQLGGIRVGGRLELPAIGTAGEVVTVGRLVHSEDQGVLVRAQVHEGVERLRPGQFVEVRFGTARDGGAGWRVPAKALARNAGAAYVFVRRDGAFEALPVQVLAEEEHDAVVGGALQGSDRIAVGGVAALKAAWLGAAD